MIAYMTLSGWSRVRRHCKVSNDNDMSVRYGQGRPKKNDGGEVELKKGIEGAEPLEP